MKEKHRELASYIDLLNKKRAAMKRKIRRNNLRIDAVLREALDNALVQLRRRQIEDIEEWQRKQASEVERFREEQRLKFEKEDKYDPFSDPNLSDELGSLNNFMNALSRCKVVRAQC